MIGLFTGVISSLVAKLVLSLGRLLAAIIVLGLISGALYLTSGLIADFLGQFWLVPLILLITVALIGPELGRLRYTMQRSHTDFMTQTRGPKHIDYQQDNEPWDPYFTD